MKLNKKDLIELSSITILTLLLCSNFLQVHFSSDTYVLYDLGYFDYPSHYFLRDSRFFSAIACYIGGLLNLPYPVYIILMDFIGMIFLSISIFMISKIIRNILTPKTILFEILIILASHFLILNQFSLEYLLFPESAIMCMGIFFLVLALKVLVKNPKNKYLKIIGCLCITMLSYQAELNIFPLLVALVYILKQIKEKEKIKVFLKNFIKEMFKIALIMLVLIIISLILVAITKNLFEDKKTHFIKIVSERTFWLRFKAIKSYAKEIWIYGIHFIPKNSLTITVITTLLLLFITKSNKQTYFYYIFLCILSFLSCIIPLFVCNSGACGRVNVPTMMILGLSALILISSALTKNLETRKLCVFKFYVAPTFTILLFLINSIFIIQNTTEHIAANKIDDNTGSTINSIIKNYEEQNNITVTNFAYTYDYHPQQYSISIKPLQSMTERKFACEWSVLSAMNYYCNKKFNSVPFEYHNEENAVSKEYINKEYFTDYTCFSNNQIFFKDDTVYMIIY